MNSRREIERWQHALAFLRELSRKLPSTWPKELPPEDHPQFWAIALRLEKERSEAVDEWLAHALCGELRLIDPLNSWLVGRRLELAGQWVLEFAAKPSAIPKRLSDLEILVWLMVVSWQETGRDAFVRFALRQQPRG